MSSERLLKRIRYWGKGQEDRGTRLDAGEYSRSVMKDLELLYNTKKGTVLISDDMGMPDFTGLLNRFGPQEIATMERSFRELTERYEPRFRSVSVRFLPRDNEFGVLRFVVSGALPFKTQNLPLEFSALVQGNGSVTIES